MSVSLNLLNYYFLASYVPIMLHVSICQMLLWVSYNIPLIVLHDVLAPGGNRSLESSDITHYPKVYICIIYTTYKWEVGIKADLTVGYFLFSALVRVKWAWPSSFHRHTWRITLVLGLKRDRGMYRVKKACAVSPNCPGTLSLKILFLWMFLPSTGYCGKDSSKRPGCGAL